MDRQGANQLEDCKEKEGEGWEEKEKNKRGNFNSGFQDLCTE